MRRCAECETIKPLNEIHNDKNRPFGKSYRCKPCGSRHREIGHLKSKYGLTEDQHNEMIKNQNGACAICNSTDTGIERTKKLSIDHCHKTNKVRGLLCNWCNQGLGHFRDSPELLLNAIKYLSKERL